MASGKTTIKDIIMKIYPEYIHMAFGQKVKDIAKDLFDMNVKNRDLLVKIGTSMREIDPDIWAKYLMKEIHKKANVHPVIIDDLRYYNEYEVITKNTGEWFIINIEVSSKLQLKRLKETYPHNWEMHKKYINHHSEKKHLKNINYDLIVDMDFYEKQSLNLDTFKSYFETIIRGELEKYMMLS